MTQERMSLVGLLNMNAGWIGIQFGWGLQLAYASALFEFLGARPTDLALLWLPAPLSGLFVQPLAGHLSDRMWTRWGRRRPLFLGGAIMGAIALALLPRATSLRMATGLICVLDCAANVASVAFRAFVGDLLPSDQQTQGFAVQSILICLGAVSASAFAYACETFLGKSDSWDEGVPRPIRFAFYTGAVVYVVSASWTVFTTPERDVHIGGVAKTQRVTVGQVLRAPLYGLRTMPPTMKQLAPVHCLGHAGLYLFYLYLAPGISRVHFGARDEQDPRYTQGVEFAGVMISTYNMVAAPFAIVLPKIAAKIGRPVAHSAALCVGGLSLILVRLAPNKATLLACMFGTGLAWASILTLPFAMLLSCLSQESVGMYVGVNNLFVVLPEVVGSLVAGWVLENLLGGQELSQIAVGGCFMLLGSLLSLRIDDVGARREGAGKFEMVSGSPQKVRSPPRVLQTPALDLEQ
eukprot:Hpha_TRINITY_DN24156_c0_g1::TRINITY_DN24156_c0_g1_i1::g.9763::m.9763/K16211/malY, malT; maltose/moltooligosaccharide transporter